MKHLMNKKVNKKREDVEGYFCIPCMGSCSLTCYGGFIVDVG